MAYQIKILLLAFAIAFVISLIVIPILKRKKIGQNERNDGPKSHLKKKGTPTMGGIIMIFGLIGMGVILYFDYSRSTAESERLVAKNLIPLLAATIGFGLIGFVDDFKKLVLNNTEGLKPALKMLGLLIVATVCFAPVVEPFCTFAYFFNKKLVGGVLTTKSKLLSS